MHITDGIVPLDRPGGIALLGGSWLLAAAGSFYSARRLPPEEAPRVGLVACCVFVASSVPVMIGPVSLHLGLYGLAGFLLRRRVWLATVPALILQFLLVRHGGFTTLGLNAVTTGLAAGVGWACASLPGPRPLRAFIAGAGGTLCGAALVACVLFALSGWNRPLMLFFSGYPLLAIVEGMVTVAAIEAVARLRPRALAPPENPA